MTKSEQQERKQKIRERYKGADTSRIKVIPAKSSEHLETSNTIRRVAAYVRVSTDNDEQTSSYELQKNYYMAFVRMIYRDMRWDRDNTYRLEGKSIPGQQLVSFDLSSPFLVENGLALNETTNPTKPLCGEEMSSAESSSASSIKRDSGAV